MKNSFLNNKVYDLLAVIDLNKITNWAEVKAESVWTNVVFKSHKEINNNSQLCFLFVTRSFSDLTNFSIFLQDDKNNKIELAASEKKNKYF